MAKVLRIYLPPAPAPNLGKFEVYRDGKRTGELIGNADIRAFLTREQYIAFLNGDDIFQVPANKFRTRNHRKGHTQNKKTIKLNRNG